MRILCIGDSNTWGYEPGTGRRLEGRWTRVLAKLMQEEEIIEEGMNGRTLLSVDPLIPERCGIKSLKVLLLSHKPVDCVVLMLGTNELKSFFPCSAKHIAQGVAAFLKMITDASVWGDFPVPKVLVVSPVTVRKELVTIGSSFVDFTGVSVAESERMGEEIAAVCNTYGVSFLDASEYAQASITDCIHMDEENHKKLGEIIAVKIKELRKY